MSNGSKSFLEPGKRPSHIVCPNCQLRQPLALDCVGCGAIIDLDKAMALASAPAPSPAPPAPAVAAPAPAARPAAASGSFLGEASPDFIPLADPPPRVEEPAETEGGVYAGPGTGAAAGPAAAGPAADDGVYRGQNPFSEDGAHSRFGTRGPEAEYRDGQLRPDELSAFSILGEAFSLFGRNFVGFTLIAGIAMLPAIFFSLHTASELAAVSSNFQDVDEPAMADVRSVLILIGLDALFTFLCMPIATSAVTYGVGRELRKEGTTMIDCIQAGVRVLLPVLGVTVAQTIIVGLFGLVIFGISIAVLMPVIVTLPCMGIVGLFIPLFLVAALAAAFAVTIPATVEERPGVVGALKTSWALTDGARMTIVFFYFALGAVGVILTVVLGVLGGLFTEEASQLALQVAQVLVTAINAVGAAVFYFRLRSAAERVPIVELSSAA